MKMLIRSLFLSGILLTSGFSAYADSKSNADNLIFSVMRKGDEIGTHVIKFDRSPEKLHVTIQTNVVVTLPLIPIPVYKFEHDGEEFWSAQKLNHLISVTNDDGAAHKLDVNTSGETLSVVGDGIMMESLNTIIPASLWNKQIINSQKILNTLDGHEMAVSITDMGEEQIEASGETISAQHFKIAGDLNREVWYDVNERLVGVKFEGSDGSEIHYILQ